MSHITCLTIIVTFGFIQMVTSNNWQYDLRQGRCTGDKLVNEDITKSASPYTTKKLTYTWSGINMYYISCINVYNKMGSSQAGSVRIIQGGVGQSEVILEMMTKNGKGMDFHFDLYGEELRRTH
ncbi:hypothetical protein NQ314_002447 [Rhamnusium bicolor]|uniref:Uncharacterized protein n=1 Tax=Rhamnusium bicolor TaxID=1586634 RepID=A0AAV8ZQV1_9CUCU|nr:hypothetical protein NQ314_002447 [Rhamnusium bicolor]